MSYTWTHPCPHRKCRTEAGLGQSGGKGQCGTSGDARGSGRVGGVVVRWVNIGELPRWISSKESTCQCRRHKFDPWVRKVPCRRKWQPTPVFLPGKFHGQRSLAVYSPWGGKELDTTECMHTYTHTPTHITLFSSRHFHTYHFIVSSCENERRNGRNPITKKEN